MENVALPPIDHFPLHEIPDWNWTSLLWTPITYAECFNADNPLKFAMLGLEERAGILKKLARSKSALIEEAQCNWVINLAIREFFKPRDPIEPLPFSLLELPVANLDSILGKMTPEAFAKMLRSCKLVRDRVSRHSDRYRIHVRRYSLVVSEKGIVISKAKHFNLSQTRSNTDRLLSPYVFKKIAMVSTPPSKPEEVGRVVDSLKLSTGKVSLSVGCRRVTLPWAAQINPTKLTLNQIDEEKMELIRELTRLSKVEICPMPDSSTLLSVFGYIPNVKITTVGETADLTPVYDYMAKWNAGGAAEKIRFVTIVMRHWSDSVEHFFRSYIIPYIYQTVTTLPAPNSSTFRVLFYLFPRIDSQKHCLVLQTEVKALLRENFGYQKDVSLYIHFELETVGDLLSFLFKRLFCNLPIDFSGIDLESRDFTSFFQLMCSYFPSE